MAIVVEGYLKCPGCREYVIEADEEQYPDGVDYETPYADESKTKCRMCRVHEDGSDEECEPDCSDCSENQADAEEEAEAERLRLLTQERKAGAVFWFNEVTVEVVDRVTGDVVATGPGFDPFTRTLIRPGKRDEVTVVAVPWNPDTAEITPLVEVRRGDGSTERWYPSRVGLALRYTSGNVGYVWDFVESYWTAHDAKTGQELVPGRDVVHDRKRDNRPATVLAMSSIGHFQVRYEDDEQLTRYLGSCRLVPADYGVVTKQWTVDIELGAPTGGEQAA
ncbi:hypothetical protein [Streptomyces niveus]|uniref:hypothetical protein n=1 Tax=Streptomyces niveus TaxID=193462 RepID=UPI003430E995